MHVYIECRAVCVCVWGGGCSCVCVGGAVAVCVWGAVAVCVCVSRYLVCGCLIKDFQT